MVKVQESTGFVIIGHKKKREFRTFYKNKDDININDKLDEAVARAKEIALEPDPKVLSL